jgi:hypothetical protein
LTVAALASACGREAGAGETGVRVVGVFEPPRAGYFWAPVDVAVDGDRVWVLDAGAGQIFAYDTLGGYRAAIGRKGRGPGELQDPLALGVAGDSLWVLDIGNGRIEHFARSGAHLRSQTLPDGLPTPVDMVRWEGSFVGTLPFGDRPLARLGPEGRPFLFGAELAARARQLAPGDGRIPSIYRLAVVDEELWAAHLYLPLVGIFGPEGRLRRLLEYEAPDPAPVRTRIEKREGGERRLERAPRRPAGGLGVLPLGNARLLLTHRRDDEGRQVLIAWRGDDAGARTVWGPPDLLLVSAAAGGRRSFAVGARGDVEEPAVLILETAGPAGSLASPADSDTLRAECPERPPALGLVRRPTGREITRILAAPDGILLGTPEGLFRAAGGRTVRLLPGGKDWALAKGVLARLGEGRIDLFDYRPREAPAPRAALAAGRHEASIALAAGDLFVHSAFHDDALILRRSLEDGAVVGQALPVQRDLFRTLLEGPGRLHEDEGRLVSEADRVVQVPAVRDPITVLGTAGGPLRVLELAGDRRGAVRVDRELRREKRRCRLCIRRIEIEGRVSVSSLYPAAAMAEGVLWLVRLEPPGSSNAVLLRADVEARQVRAWRLVLPGPPTALAVAGDTLVVAADRDLWTVPAPTKGALCRLSAS